ncbi:hypothetical protein DL240_13335 [Lujinxingia litoralis]|uniref:Uncharacterized protein n=1 Tax=Lujinxingia litoralis TaxID=2211119 RepID=A0A328C843_9DELT|nr:AIM24 family protein [Lujinxingia litoralis]RAL21828.1 hypothetical protein DL240_13335 [Lujinxingia litoralis]
MRLLAALTAALLKALLVIGGLMALLFVGALLLDEAGPRIRQAVQTPQRLKDLQDASRQGVEEAAAHQGRAVATRARILALDRQRLLASADWQRQTRAELASIEHEARQQIQRTRQGVAESRQTLEQSTRRLEARYCQSFNPVDWWTCRTLREQLASMERSASMQRAAVERAAAQIERQATARATAFEHQAHAQLTATTAELDALRERSADDLLHLEDQRDALLHQAAQLHSEEARLRQERWLVLEFQKRWPALLALALLIALSPYLRRTLWYFVALPLLSRARPIELHPRAPAFDDLAPDTDTRAFDDLAPDTDAHAFDDLAPDTPRLHTTPAQRTLTLTLAPHERLLARPGYILSDREGASTALFFDRRAPNLSFISGLVLLTRLPGPAPTSATGDAPARPITLGSPHDADAYLMQVDLHEHPGVVFRSSRVVAIRGDIAITSRWRLFNWHAWATSQVRFLIFHGTGSLIVEGYGDVQAPTLQGDRAEKRQPNILGFDAGLTYRTRRAATFLPYLLDPQREPLVVDLFEGEGTYFFEKNPAARQRQRSPAQAVAGFFFDALRRLLGL